MKELDLAGVTICTRNDLIECLAVAAAGVLVWVTGSRWPDLVGGVLLAGVFLSSAFQIVRQAREEHRAAVATS